MKNLLNFFFSFDKLFKEKLVVPFFWLALVVFSLAFFAEVLDFVRLGPLASVVEFVNTIASFLLVLVVIRILAELMVAVFRINDNLSPDKGRSELADIDPVAEARKAAELAAQRTREATKTVTEKASSATKNLRENVGDMTDTVGEKAKAATASVREKADDITHSAKEKTESVMGKGTVPKASDAPTPVKALEPSAVDAKPAAKKASAPKKVEPKPKAKPRGRPAGSKNKTTTAKKPAVKKPAAKKPTAKKSMAGKKRGPKPGVKVPRDADGNLLKKDGTPRKKPGPKSN